MEVYRSGHNEAVLKTVWVKAPGGSNPSTSARDSDAILVAKESSSHKVNCFFFFSFLCVLPPHQ